MRARRSGNGSNVRSGTRTSSTGARRWSANCAASPAPRSSGSARTGGPRRPRPTSTARWTTSTPPSATAPSAPSRWCCAWASSTTPTRRSCRRSRPPPPPAPAAGAWRAAGPPRRPGRPRVAPPAPSRAGGVRVKGVGDLLVRFGKCCHPIPGDPISGFITRGKGITVHLRSCPTVLNERDVNRLIEVDWEDQLQQTYPIAIRIEAFDRTGLLSDISNVVAENKVNILAANVTTNADHTATVVATLQVAPVPPLARGRPGGAGDEERAVALPLGDGLERVGNPRLAQGPPRPDGAPDRDRQPVADE